MTKLADGPTTEVSIDIDAAPEVVWALVTDVDLPARFSQEFQGGEWLDADTAPQIGSRFKGRNRRGEREWEVVCTVVSSDPGRQFGWAVNDPEDPAAVWHFGLDPIASGTRLSQHVRLGPGPSGLSRAIESAPDNEDRIVAGRLGELADNMAATVAGIKALAESP